MRLLFTVIVLLCSAYVGAQPGGATAWPDTARHRSAFALVNGIQLHYLDWGGAGPPLVFIPGNGDSPHIFDGLAARFSDEYRVVAYARRGNGQSDKPTTGYDLDTFVEDLRALIDSINISRTVLVAWSMGGAEMTRFAARYPQRVSRLVYLDAAFDWTDYAPVRMLRPQWPEPPGVRKSFLAFREWTRGLTPSIPWTAATEAALRDLLIVNPDGSVADIIPDSVSAAMVRVLDSAHREYAELQSPALAIYARQSVKTLVPAGASDDFRGQMARWVREGRGPWLESNVARFKREVKNGLVVEFPDTDHAVFLQREDEVAAQMRTFLGAR